MATGVAAAQNGAPGKPPRRSDVDLLRILSIVFIVFIHSSNGFEYTSFEAALRNVSYLAVPLFAFLSGYSLSLSASREKTSRRTVRRIRKIGIPWLVWSAIYTALYWLKFPGQFSDPLSLFANVSMSTYTPLWFIFVLFQLYIIYYFIQRYRINVGPMLLLASLLLLFLWYVLPELYIQMAPLLLFYFLLGIWLQHHPVSLTPLLATVLGAAALVSLLNIGLTTDTFYGRGLWVPANASIFVLCSMLLYFGITSKVRLGPSDRISSMAMATLGVYLVHPLVINVLSFFSLNTLFGAASIYVLWALVVVISFLLVMIVSRIKIVNGILW